MRAFKLMLLGEIGVGKSSIANRVKFDRFSTDYKPTIGVDVARYDVPPLPGLPNISLIIWDTDGNFGDAIFTHTYLRQADGALIVADASRLFTVDAQRHLAEGFLRERPGRYCGLVLNKLDLVGEREQQALASDLSDLDLPLTMTSAKSGMNVVQAFQHAASTIARRTL
jgi:Ras-related protein Rab-22